MIKKTKNKKQRFKTKKKRKKRRLKSFLVVSFEEVKAL